MAPWSEDIFGVPPTRVPDTAGIVQASQRPVNVHCYLKANFHKPDEEIDTLFLAHVSWYFPHPSRSVIGKPAEIWCNNMYESFGVHSFLPVQNFICRCAHGTMQLSDEEVLLVIPLVE
jgi:hypothetical protein